jgi:DNA-binding NarL/FixJ family response regulator
MTEHLPVSPRALRRVPLVGRHEELLLTLTERELSVAYVVAGGRTNQEAAAELYVSQKTVEYHLSHIYAKLGISSRRQLGQALQALES